MQKEHRLEELCLFVWGRAPLESVVLSGKLVVRRGRPVICRQPMLMSERSRFGSVDGAGLSKDVTQVIGDRIEADEQFVRDLLIVLASREQAQHLDFALRESRRMNDPALSLLPLRA